MIHDPYDFHKNILYVKTMWKEFLKKYYIEKQYEKCTGINNTTYPKTLTMYSFILSLKKSYSYSLYSLSNYIVNSVNKS